MRLEFFLFTLSLMIIIGLFCWIVDVIRRINANG